MSWVSLIFVHCAGDPLTSLTPTDELVNEGRSALKKAKGIYNQRAAGWTAIVDEHLASLWRSSWQTAYNQNERSGGIDPLFADLSRILSHVKGVFIDYKNMRAAWASAKVRCLLLVSP